MLTFRLRGRHALNSIGLHKTRLLLQAPSYKHGYKSARAKSSLKPRCIPTAAISTFSKSSVFGKQSLPRWNKRVSSQRLLPFVKLFSSRRDPRRVCCVILCCQTKQNRRRMVLPRGPHSPDLPWFWKPLPERNSIIIQYPSIRQSIHPSPFQVDSPKREKKIPISSGTGFDAANTIFFLLLLHINLNFLDVL